jgi:transcriptional regulator with XRE-family HTH domain
VPEKSVPPRRLALGEAVRRVRDRRGWTQEQLAERVGFDRKSINRLEKGATAVSVDRLWVIADALDVAIGDLESAALAIVSGPEPPRAPAPQDRTTPPG